mgnify:CR=1 FL=1
MSVKQVEVCFSPFHIPLFDLRKKAVVVIDVYRATSAIVAGIGTGVEKIIPVSTVDEAKEYRAKGYITAAERKGAVVAGFDIGNSPITFSDPQYKGKSIVLTTSNGTKALLKATQAKEIIVAAFLNETAVAEYVNKNHDSVMILCAGWRDRFNLEDTVVAGSIAKKLLDLGWNNSVLKFHEHAQKKFVSSPTYNDVTKKIYKGAMGRWKNYEKHLEPHMHILEPYMEAFGYR